MAQRYRIKATGRQSWMFTRQTKIPRRTFPTIQKAEEYGIGRWGYGSQNSGLAGWKIVKVKHRK